MTRSALIFRWSSGLSCAKNLPLAKGVVKGVVDGGHGHSKASRGVTVDDQGGLETVQLLIGIYIPEFRDF